MPRLFTGIEIPAEIGERLALLRGGLPGARWITQENYHLTLRFVGDIDGHIAHEIADSLGRVQRFGFDVSIDGLGSFGTRKPHALIARVPPSRPLVELQSEHERLLQRLGLPPDQRKFTPHITLARLRGSSGRDVAEYLTTRGGFFSEPIPVSRFVLFSARSSVGGGPYVVEEAYPLLPPAPAFTEDYDGQPLNR
ncbi:RNA 2',3'-cyclic phosphodiesterase [Bauldia sp.]|uniref:RNA 2',3'-cyclic phosphodiesterase n=1 Tax=Bauldia sp. TaxID=2575872 RepID=UPI003BA93DAD